MRSVFTVTAADLRDAVVDTRYDLRVVGITKEDAGAVKARLRDLYGKDFDVGEGELTVPGDDSLFKTRHSVGDLMHVMKRLTAEDGCPWDKAQTHASIRVNAVEEAYELSEAIDSGDVDNLREETGDLLLQAVFHMDIAERTGEFTRADVLTELVHKLVSRHTHIFGSEKATSPEEALRAWEAAKAVEKKASGLDAQLARIPESFPALLRAQKTVRKLVKDGLVNDAPPAGADDLLRVLCGCLLTGADAEVDLPKALAELVEGYKSGRFAKVSDVGADKA